MGRGVPRALTLRHGRRSLGPASRSLDDRSLVHELPMDRLQVALRVRAGPAGNIRHCGGRSGRPTWRSAAHRRSASQPPGGGRLAVKPRDVQERGCSVRPAMPAEICRSRAGSRTAEAIDQNGTTTSEPGRDTLQRCCAPPFSRLLCLLCSRAVAETTTTLRMPQSDRQHLSTRPGRRLQCPRRSS